ncbi:MAG: hypothetical protein HN553_10050, partial [Opitutae bacterium]|nr:hypothetical protein [Opitutae bacterium]
FSHALASGGANAHVIFDQGGAKELGVFDGGNFMTTFGATSLSVGWHHLVAIGNGGQTSFWVDGVAVGSVDANVASVVEVIGNHTGGFGRFSDKIDDFRIYSRTLGVSEVIELFGEGNGDFGSHPYNTNSPIFDNSPEILLPSNPIVHWTFDELNGTSIIDSSGKGNVGNADSFSNLYLHSVPGRDGTALRFDENQTVLLPNDFSKFNLTGPFTICFWLHTDDLDGYIFNSDRIKFYISNGFISAEARIGGSWKLSNVFPLTSGQWVHYIYQWDGNKITIYTNTEEVVAPFNAKGGLAGNGSDTNFYFGGKTPLMDFISGSLDDLRIFDQGLSSKERQSVYEFANSPLIARYGEEYSYEIESVKGPTEYNATNLPPGLEVDAVSGLLFGVPTAVGEYDSTLFASNISGWDSELIKLVVLRGQQSISFNQDLGVLSYGASPIDLNFTSLSGLPVVLDLVEGNSSVDLNGSILTILNPGTVRIRASQSGDSNWLSAEPFYLDFQIMKKELIVRVHDQFRKSDQVNPTFTYSFEGFAYDDNESILIQGVSVSTSVGDGNLSVPTAGGLYSINAGGVISDKYFVTYLDGTLTVSDKTQHELIFDQNLSSVSATLSSLLMTGYSRTMDGNLTELPLLYEVEDESVARILTTRADILTAYWKLDEKLYNAAKDITGNYNGTLLDINVTGVSNAWVRGRFGNGLKLGPANGRVVTGSVPVNGSFTLSLWLNSSDLNSPESLIISKDGFVPMNVFNLKKQNGNGRISFNLSTDGNATEVNLPSLLPVLKHDQWVHVAVVYDDSNDSNRTASLFVDGNLSNQVSSISISGLPLKQRYSALEIGGSNNPFNGLVDDVRIYDGSLSSSEITQIYGMGGGDFKTLEIIGAGTTKLTAIQDGNDEFAPAIPVINYLNVMKASQEITFSPIVDQSVGDFPFYLDANSSSGLAVQFATSDPTKATITGSKVYVHAPGLVT